MKTRAVAPTLALALAFAVGACGRADRTRPTDAPESAPRATIAFGGDVNLGRRQNAISARNGFDEALGAVEELRDADLAIANLESVVSAVGASGVEKGERTPFYFRGRPETLNVLLSAGIDAVATANNHSGDFGPDALLDQGELLEAAGIAYAGSGRDVAAACAPAFLPAGELTAALFSVDATMPYFAAGPATAGTCHVPLEDAAAWSATFAERFREAHESAHLVLVAVHWGPNFVDSPSDEKREIGRLLVDLGADAVLGSSAHVLQGIEVHRERPIIHDAGNLLFDSQEGPVESAVFILEVSASGVHDVRIEPLVSDYGFTRPAAGQEAARILDRVGELSADLGTPIVEGRISLAPPHRPAPPDATAIPSRTPRPGSIAERPPPGCEVDAVPITARREARRIGPLILQGFSAAPDPVDPRSLLWVDSYWSIDEHVPRDLWISLIAEPTDSGGPSWRADHEPCDWGWPTSRWERGRIYHDRYPMRPRADPGTELALRIAVLDDGDSAGASGVLLRLAVAPTEP